MWKLLIILWALSYNLFATTIYTDDKRPDDFVNVQQIIPRLQLDMRYASQHNFVGRKIIGYKAPVCLLTMKAAKALKTVADKLLVMGLTLKVYDCYRPQMAVDDFANWAIDVNDNKMKAEFYPDLDKRNLFNTTQNYIAKYSGHTRGSTLDLTIVPLNSQVPEYTKDMPLVSCTEAKESRFPDNSLDFGTGFDCFNIQSHYRSLMVNPQARANRLLLHTLMQNAGFKGIDEEWWHFTLIKEPYPNTYFNFPVQ